eukprot:snap_masked-scaffold_77-processed-gene-0.29-mRNA-1 protein AED:0.32 eAED:0.36 QI:0/0/0/0.33/1/1/3/0/636
METIRGSIEASNQFISKNHVNLNFRALTSDEISTLKQFHNTSTSQDFNNIKVLMENPPLDISLFRNNHFSGFIFLGEFIKNSTVKTKDGFPLPCGVYNSVLDNCVLLGCSRISNCSLISTCYIEKKCILLNCGTITRGISSFGIGQDVKVVNSAGGRKVCFDPDLSFNQISKNILSKERYISDTLKSLPVCFFNIIKENCFLSLTTAKDIFLDRNNTFENSTLKDALFLEKNKVKSSTIEYSIIKKQCEFTDSNISRSFIFPETIIDSYAKIKSSVLGPLSHISQGEVSYSVLGPLVGFNHTATLTACYWPSGKGNVSLGALIGSNHTSRKPDQEFFSGEGIFFGLGSIVKYPCNLLDSPYSLIATGVTVLPQKISFPFSLITSEEMIPGWMLKQGLYTIFRNQLKFLQRSVKLQSLIFEDSKEQINLICGIFRPEIMALVYEANERIKEYFNSGKEIEGLGKQIVSKTNLKAAKDVYTFWLELDALEEVVLRSGSKEELRTVLEEIKESSLIDEFDILSKCKQDNSFTGLVSKKKFTENNKVLKGNWWEIQKSSLKELITKTSEEETLISIYKEKLDTMLKYIVEGKRKDDIRGPKILPEYSEYHITSEDDDIVITVKKQIEIKKGAVEKKFQNN